MRNQALNKIKKLKDNFRFRLFFFVFVALVSMSFKISASRLGGNFDLYSSEIVSNLAAEGKSVYANTNRYNYGPITYYYLGIIRILLNSQGNTSLMDFHTALVLFLSVAEIGIAVLLWKLYGYLPALLFLSNPVSFILTGYHSQYEAVAMLLGFLSWFLYLKSEDSSGKSNFYRLLSAFVLGLSLMTKHFLFIFPIWIFFLSLRKKPLMKNILWGVFYCVIAYTVFFSGFGIEIARNMGDRDRTVLGITENVFRYQGPYGSSAFVTLLNLYIPKYFISFIFDSLPVFKGYTAIFILALVFVGFLVSKHFKNSKLILPVYLLSMFSLSPSIADQYIAIVLPAVAVFNNSVIILIFNIVVFSHLASGDSANISNLQSFNMNLGSRFSSPLAFYPWNLYKVFNTLNFHAWILLFFAMQMINIIFSISIRDNFRSLFVVNIGRFVKKVCPYRFLLLILCDIVLTCLLLLYLIVKFKYGGGFVDVTGATYGKNCKATAGNYTIIAEQECRGKSSCTLTVGPSDPVPFCEKDFSITWRCRSDTPFYPVYFTDISKEAYGKSVSLTCPQSQLHCIVVNGSALINSCNAKSDGISRPKNLK